MCCRQVLVCARPNAISQAGYALSIAAGIQDFYENFYNITYPMPRTGYSYNITYPMPRTDYFYNITYPMPRKGYF